MEVTTLKETMEKPNRKDYKKGVYCEPLMAFVDSDQGTLKYSFTNGKDASICATSVHQYIRKHDLNLVVWRKKNDVYVIKG